MRIFLLSLSLLAAAACSDDQPAQPTAEQSDQLNEADAMLNDLAKEEGPADRSASPSNSSD